MLMPMIRWLVPVLRGHVRRNGLGAIIHLALVLCLECHGSVRQG